MSSLVSRSIEPCAGMIACRAHLILPVQTGDRPNE